MLLTPKLLNEVWNRARRCSIGLWIRVENRTTVHHALTLARPPDMTEYTLAFIDDLNILYITVPGTTLEGVPVEPGQEPDLT